MHSCGLGPCSLGADCLARWTGPLSRALARSIQSITLVDEDGRRYYRKSWSEGWRRLRTDEDFKRLNAAIDEERR